jgi:hypothetical protein
MTGQLLGLTRVQTTNPVGVRPSTFILRKPDPGVNPLPPTCPARGEPSKPGTVLHDG